ncbi:MAG TPA: SurA N-terminal domain-containing protein [Candidatus Aphodousia gallistercoris]|nr:SurA N-terminal domain-containing protein [Candidatus Aphodousia gallistercoris]
MLQAFRTHKRWMMFIAMIFIIPSFVVTGIYSYNRMSDDENDIATVGDTSITMMDFDNAKRMALDNLRRQMGNSFKANMLDTQEARVMILNNLIAERALMLEMTGDYVSVGEADAINMIKQAPAFQRNGQFSTEVYKQFLNSMGKSDEQFVQELRRDLSREMLINSVAGTSLGSTAMAQRIHDLLTETRTVRTYTILPSRYMDKVSVSDEEAQKYYADNQALFAVPESVDIEYVVLSPEIYTDIKASEDDIKTFYEQNPQRFATPEQRSASHILIATAGVEEAAAKKEADDVLAQVKADPKQFEKLAKEHSDDPGSAQNGGKLGFFGRGMMVPEFEQAVFNGKKGDIVGPVKTAFGYHIIRIDDVRAQQIKPLDEVRDEIQSLYVQQKAMELFAEDAETFSNMVYEQSESLDPVIERFKLKKQTAQGITRDYEDQLINQGVVEALYSFDVLSDKRNSNAIEVAPNTLISARVVEHHPRSTKAFADVKGDIVTALKNQKAAQLTKVEGEKELAQWQTTKKGNTKFSEKVEVSRENPNGLGFDVVTAALRPAAQALPSYTGVQSQNGAYVVIEVLDSKKTEPTPEELAMRKAELAQLYSLAETNVYMDALQNKFGVQILKDEYKPGYNPEEDPEH